MNPSRNATGALLMVIAMAAFTCNDALVKSTTGAMNTGQILFVRGAMTSVLVVAIDNPKKRQGPNPNVRKRRSEFGAWPR